MLNRKIFNPLVVCGLFLIAGRLTAGVDRWTPLGPDGGAVTALAPAPGVSGLVYAGTVAAGVFKSRDGGASWQPALKGLPAGDPILFLTAGGRDGRTLYAATWSSLYATADGGGLWTRRALPFQRPDRPSGSITALAASPSAPQTVYLAYDQDLTKGLLKSTDGGRTWKTIETGLGFHEEPPSIVTIAFAPSASETVYVATYGFMGGVGRSTDGGDHWSAAADLGDEAAYGGIKLAVDPRDARTVYAAWEDKVARSTDGGAAWTRLTDVGSAPEDLIRNAADLAIDPTAPGTIYFAFNRSVPGYNGWYGGGILKDDGRIVRTTDGGATWSRPAVTDVVAALKVDGVRTSRVYAGVSRLGILRSIDRGVQWSKANRGLQAAPVCAVTPDPFTRGLLYIAAGLCGTPYDLLGSNSDLGFLKGLAGPVPGWTTVNQGARNPVRVLEAHGLVPDPRTPGTLYAATGYGLFKSVNGGARWESLQGGLGPILDSVFRVAIDPSDPRTLYAAGYKLGYPICGGFCPLLPVYDVAKSTDGGITWKKILPPALAFIADERDYTGFDLVIDPADPRVLYLAPLLKSTDGGATWKLLQVRIDPVPGRGSVARLVVDPADSQTLYAAAHFSGYPDMVVKSTDGGHSWASAGQGLPQSPSVSVRDLALDRARPATLYAATSQGVYLSDDGGEHWSPLSSGLTKRNIWTISLDPFDPATLYAGTEGDGGLFVLTRSDR
jgi:photosystem II stability/assembly factor-like uncharacterized protein